MNFALYMLGQAVSSQGTVILRPSPVERLLRKAAGEAAVGNLETAAEIYEQLVGDRTDVVGPALVLAQLRHLRGEHGLAANGFDQVISRLMGDPVKEPAAETNDERMPAARPEADEEAESDRRVSTLERMIASADRDLRAGKFPRAISTLHGAMESIETLLAANAGLIVSDARRSGNASPKQAERLIPIALLGDVLLRLFARANLASNLAESLRKRRMREDLALWATGKESVDHLLVKQYEQLAEGAKRHPSHIDLHYRMGFIARALGRLQEAEAAFSKVLTLHPHHLVAAALLAATHLQLGRTEAVMPMLAVALAVGPEVMGRYYAIAEAAADMETFDRSVDMLVRSAAATGADAKSIRANLALALSELGMMDQAHAPWRNPMVSSPQS